VKLVSTILSPVVGIILNLDQSQVVTSAIHLTALICRANNFLDGVQEKKNIIVYIIQLTELEQSTDQAIYGRVKVVF